MEYALPSLGLLAWTVIVALCVALALMLVLIAIDGRKEIKQMFTGFEDRCANGLCRVLMWPVNARHRIKEKYSRWSNHWFGPTNKTI